MSLILNDLTKLNKLMMYDETSLYKTVLPMLKKVNIQYQYDNDKEN